MTVQNNYPPTLKEIQKQYKHIYHWYLIAVLALFVIVQTGTGLMTFAGK